MPKKGVNISLKGYDDIFSTEQSRTEEQQERVQEIPLSELHPFEGHPFNLDDDAAIMLMVDANLQRETILPSERAFANLCEGFFEAV